MNIAYHGKFLREGLIAAGHKVHDLPNASHVPLNAAIANVPGAIDLVLVELFGSDAPIQGVSACAYPTVGYIIDGPLNEFWAQYAARIFDYVFVDQKSSKEFLESLAIKSYWLPLCAQDDYFQPHRHKEYDLVFVGKIDTHRIKRKNILTYLQSNFNIVCADTLSFKEALALFSRSKVVLNENLFAGMTLRQLQVFSANSLLFTEANSYGLSDYFTENCHYVTYDFHNIYDKLVHILNHYDSYLSGITAANDLCQKAHTSKHRTEEFLYALNNAPNSLTPNERLLYEMQARYRLILRYGGYMKPIVAYFTAAATGEFAAAACCELGDIFSRRKKFAQAEKYYQAAHNNTASILPQLKLALLYWAWDKRDRTQKLVENMWSQAALPADQAANGDLLCQIAHLYFAQSRLFHLGFQKFVPDIVPDTAYEVARMAWQHNRSPQALDLMLRCLAPYHLEGELLPDLLTAIQSGILSKTMILRSAEIASQYYDFSTASCLLSAFKATRGK